MTEFHDRLEEFYVENGEHASYVDFCLQQPLVVSREHDGVPEDSVSAYRAVLAALEDWGNGRLEENWGHFLNPDAPDLNEQ